MRDALHLGMPTPAATYQIDQKWKIVRVSDAFCCAFGSTAQALIGRDVRDLLRDDWRTDFRTYVARALVGVGDYDVMLPMVAPGGEHGWYRHTLEPILEDGMLQGYSAIVVPHLVQEAAPAKPWWEWRPQSPQLVWDFDVRPLQRVT